MKTALSVLGIAALHRLLCLALGVFAAYQSSGHPLRAAVDLLTFPLSTLTGASIDWSWRDELLFILLSLGWGLVITCLIAITLWKASLPRTALLLAGGLALITILIVTIRSAPPSFSELRRVTIGENIFELPIPFEAAGSEGGVHRFALKNGQAVILAAAEEAPFRQRLDAERPGPWKRETEHVDWILESSPAGLVRVQTKQAWRSLWFGLVAEEKAIPRAKAAEILSYTAATCARTN